MKRSAPEWTIEVKEGTSPKAQTIYLTAIFRKDTPDEFRHSEYVNVERNVGVFVANAKAALLNNIVKGDREKRTIAEIETWVGIALNL